MMLIFLNRDRVPHSVYSWFHDGSKLWVLLAAIDRSVLLRDTPSGHRTCWVSSFVLHIRDAQVTLQLIFYYNIRHSSHHSSWKTYWCKARQSFRRDRCPVIRQWVISIFLIDWDLYLTWYLTWKSANWYLVGPRKDLSSTRQWARQAFPF